MAAKNVAAILIILFIFGKLTDSAINLYIPSDEVKRVLGFNAEFYFIRRGEEKWNAINHEILLAETIDHIRFFWQDEQPRSSSHLLPLFTSRIYTNDTEILQNIATTLLPQGRVPIEEKQFTVNITCNPQVLLGGSARAYLQINLTSTVGTNNMKDPLKLEFTFLKLCINRLDIQLAREKEDQIEKVPVFHDRHKERKINRGKEHNDVDEKSIFYVSVGVISSVIVMLASGVAFLHVNSLPKQLSEESKSATTENDNIQQQTENNPANIPKAVKVAIAEKQQHDIMQHLKDFVVRKNALMLGNTIQEGSFGRAYMATLINAESGEEFKVLVKSVTEQTSPEQVTLFLLESSMLKRTTHHNVLPLMHVCFEEVSTPYIIYPYMNRGNLKNYLRLTRTAEPLSKPLTTRDIVLMAIQVARGLQYLARRRYVHKDVATRNCVVDEELHVKIADNALARDFFPGDYHCLSDNENRPVRWMACESLENNTFFVASDVWSYGVLLWELSTLAQTPYANVDPFEMLSYLKSGLRLPQPPNCPDDFFTVMACCWALSPEERPHFAQIIACLEAFINKLNAFI